MQKLSVLGLAAAAGLFVLGYTYILGAPGDLMVQALVPDRKTISAPVTGARPTSSSIPATTDAPRAETDARRSLAQGNAGPMQAPAGAGSPMERQGDTGVNLVVPSENFSDPNWRSEQVSVEDNAGTAPSGTNTATRLTETGDDGLHRVEIILNGATADAVHTFSVYAKRAGRSRVMFEMRDSHGGKYGTARFDLSRRAVLLKSGDVATAGVQPQANGWYRCWAAMPFATDQVVLNLTLLDADGGPKYRGDGQSGLLIWGAQLEPKGRPTDYVPSVVDP